MKAVAVSLYHVTESESSSNQIIKSVLWDCELIIDHLENSFIPDQLSTATIFFVLNISI